MTTNPSPSRTTAIHTLKRYDFEQHMISPTRWGLDEKAGMYVLIIDETLGWWGRKALTGFSVSKKNGTWWLTVRADDRDKPVVAFSSGATYQEAIASFARTLVQKRVKWVPDKFKRNA